MTGKSSSCDTFIKLIEGSIEFMIGGKSIMMQSGQSIIIPANVSNYVKARGRFKLIVTVINSEND